ncbi:MAG: beta-lactamase family protein [Candidatus Eremiobacteraeota bacterium]|nr:beta-lactamase family protein [Candidatus Eremiobacteraeota bacterium]
MLRVERQGRLLFESASGWTRDDGYKVPAFVDTCFDLASLTKLFVATAALHFVSRGAIDLDQSLASWFPPWAGTAREGITLRRLLAHTSGMQSGADYRLLLHDRVEDYAWQHELLHAPGTAVVYSDLGFITLGLLLSSVANMTLPQIMRLVTSSETLRFRPSHSKRLAVPATENDAWRGRVQGVVHDEKAYLMGGVAGHAGLFGTAGDVAGLAALYLPKKTRARANGAILGTPVAQEAVREQAYDPELRRGLGWALKTSDANSCGRWYSGRSFGHTGFTGTCVWADPQIDLNVVLLTNSVYFGRGDIRDFRASVYEAVVEDLSS